MPQMVWDPVEVMALLGVEPEVGEYGIYTSYTCERGPLCLLLTLFPDTAVVRVELRVDPLPEPVIHFRLLDCVGLRTVNDKRGEYIEFAGGNLFTGRYDGYSVIPYGIRLWVTPQIKIEPFSSPC